jgi:rubrerythrin
MTVAEAVAESKSLAEAVSVVGEAQRQEVRKRKEQLLQGALEMLVTQHLGPRWQRRRGATPWVCLRCGPREAQQLKRNGHYRRGLVVLEGVITLRVPQLRCLECGKSVALDA